MLKKIIPVLVLLSLILVSSIVACSGNGTQNGQRIEATWIEPQVVGEIISIPISAVENYTITHFDFRAQDNDMTFMAYDLNGEIYVRANICPPCHSIGFSLDGDILVCDRCATTFKAQTGAGISGACVNYPKASVPYEVADGNIVMNSTDLITAYQDTVNATQSGEAPTPSCHGGSGTPTAPGCCSSADKPRPPSCCGP
ncbi:MAG: Fe-S-containing protein [Dehalococcoidia bacterium]|nr:Fe-S-containing protein [Dehalococcoidia bacterium]